MLIINCFQTRSSGTSPQAKMAYPKIRSKDSDPNMGITVCINFIFLISLFTFRNARVSGSCLFEFNGALQQNKEGLSLLRRVHLALKCPSLFLVSGVSSLSLEIRRAPTNKFIYPRRQVISLKRIHIIVDSLECRCRVRYPNPKQYTPCLNSLAQQLVTSRLLKSASNISAYSKYTESYKPRAQRLA